MFATGENAFRSTRRMLLEGLENPLGSSSSPSSVTGGTTDYDNNNHLNLSSKSLDDQAAEAWDKMPSVFDMYDNDDGSDFGFVPSSALIEGLDASPKKESEKGPSLSSYIVMMNMSVGTGGGSGRPSLAGSITGSLTSGRPSLTGGASLLSSGRDNHNNNKSTDSSSPNSSPMASTPGAVRRRSSSKSATVQLSAETVLQQEHVIFKLFTQFQNYHPDIQSLLDREEFADTLHTYADDFDVDLIDVCSAMMDQLVDDLAELEQRSPDNDPVLQIRRKLWERTEFGTQGMARLKSSRQLSIEENGGMDLLLCQSARSFRSLKRSRYSDDSDGEEGDHHDSDEEDELLEEVLELPIHKRSWQLFRFRLALQDLRKQREAVRRSSLKDDDDDNDFLSFYDEKSFNNTNSNYENDNRSIVSIEDEKNNKAALAVWEILVTDWTRRHEEEVKEQARVDRESSNSSSASSDTEEEIYASRSGTPFSNKENVDHRQQQQQQQQLYHDEEDTASTSTPPCSNKENVHRRRRQQQQQQQMAKSPTTPPSMPPPPTPPPPLSKSDERDLEEAWTILPKLFDLWDSNDCGTLNQSELFTGIEQYCESYNLDYDSRQIINIFDQVDDDCDLKLDCREFAVFLQLLSQRVDGFELLSMANYMMKQLMAITVCIGKDDDDTVSVLTMSSSQQNYYKKTMAAHQANNRLHKKAFRAVSSLSGSFRRVPTFLGQMIREEQLREEQVEVQPSNNNRHDDDGGGGWASEQMKQCVVSSRDVTTTTTTTPHYQQQQRQQPRRAVSQPVLRPPRRGKKTHSELATMSDDSTVMTSSISTRGGGVVVDDDDDDDATLPECDTYACTGSTTPTRAVREEPVGVVPSTKTRTTMTTTTSTTRRSTSKSSLSRTSSSKPSLSRTSSKASRSSTTTSNSKTSFRGGFARANKTTTCRGGSSSKKSNTSFRGTTKTSFRGAGMSVSDRTLGRRSRRYTSLDR